ncbi:MAG: hypothetical protein IKO61_00310 [Lachnospiraceae bacterium]|nr:hypothetical protein [Lachnospiraceae bacterium]
MKKKGNSKAGGIFAIILLGGLVIAYIATAIISLIGLGGAKKLSSNFTEAPQNGEYIDGYFYVGTELLLTMKHTMNLIPTGNEYYFAVFNDYGTQMLFVRADKKFADRFTNSEDGFFKTSDTGVSVKGKMRKMDYKEKKEFAQFVSDARADGVETVMSGDDILFLDAKTGHVAILKLIFGGCLVGAFILFVFVANVSNKEKMAASGVSPDMLPKQSVLNMEMTDVFGQPGQSAQTNSNSFADPNMQQNQFGMYNDLQPATTTNTNAATNKKVKGPKDIAAIASIILFFGGLIGILYTMTFW